MEKKFIDKITVFTDGSFIKKDKKIYCGYGIYFPNKELPNISRPFKGDNPTNQRAELFAIYVALIVIKKNFMFNTIELYTDSQYSIKSLTEWINTWKINNWKTANNKPIANMDIIGPIYDILQRLQKNNMHVIFFHVRSHTGNKDVISINNDLADNLAKLGALKNDNNNDNND